MSSGVRRWLGIVAALALAASLVLPAAAAGYGKGGGGGGGGETSVGNNLSFPVIWSDGVTKTLRGTMLVPVLEGQSVTDADGTWYLQQDPNNTWQAENVDGTAAPVNVSWVDWGDNLEGKPWPVGQQLRVETTLLEDLTTAMQGYTMKVLYGSGSTEMQGTNGVAYDSTQAIIYSGAARLTIQRIDPTLAYDPNNVPTWDAATSRWTGSAVIPNPSSTDGTFYNMAVFQTGDGPGFYAGEINVGGKIVYGYNWKTTGYAAGTYRLTFSLDKAGFEAANPGMTLNTFFDAGSQILPSAEGEAVTPAAETGGTAVEAIDVANQLSYLDVVLTGSQGGKGGRGGGGSGGGGGTTSHDAQVVSVTAPPTIAQGGTPAITATVRNNGTLSESIAVALQETPDGYTESHSVTVAAGSTGIVSFNWPTTATTALGTHTLTVTATVPEDSVASNNTGAATIQVLPGIPDSTTMSVSGISLSWQPASLNYQLTLVGVVTVKAGESPVSGATVTAKFVYGKGTTYVVSGTTDASGQVTFSKVVSKPVGTYSLTVTNVVKAGMTYDATANTVTTQTIAAP